MSYNDADVRPPSIELVTELQPGDEDEIEESEAVEA
jgi:hypothetical protein